MSDLTAGDAVCPEVPAAKLCECGCGQPTGMATKTDRQAGLVKGQPVRYRPGHWMRGKVVSEETRARISAACRGADRPNWRGDDISYEGLHRYLRDTYPKSGICNECGAHARTEWALLHGHTYSRDIKDYRELCRRCHMRYDGQLKLLPDVEAAIRVKRGQGCPVKQIAAEHGISIRTVWRVIKQPTSL
jgi:hypothetical protein